MHQNPYQAPLESCELSYDTGTRLRLIRMKALTQITFASLAIGCVAGFVWIFSVLTDRATPAYFALAGVVICSAITALSNTWLLGSSVVHAARCHEGFGYLVSALVLPVTIALFLFAR